MLLLGYIFLLLLWSIVLLFFWMFFSSRTYVCSDGWRAPIDWCLTNINVKWIHVVSFTPLDNRGPTWSYQYSVVAVVLVAVPLAIYSIRFVVSSIVSTVQQGERHRHVCHSSFHSIHPSLQSSLLARTLPPTKHSHKQCRCFGPCCSSKDGDYCYCWPCLLSHHSRHLRPVCGPLQQRRNNSHVHDRRMLLWQRYWQNHHYHYHCHYTKPRKIKLPYHTVKATMWSSRCEVVVVVEWMTTIHGIVHERQWQPQPPICNNHKYYPHTGNGGIDIESTLCWEVLRLRSCTVNDTSGNRGWTGNGFNTKRCNCYNAFNVTMHRDHRHHLATRTFPWWRTGLEWPFGKPWGWRRYR